MLNKANLVGKDFCQGENDYNTGGIFYALFLAPKIKFCSTMDDFGNIQERKTFKGVNDNKRLLGRFQYFNMIGGRKILAMLTKSWKKSFNNRIIIPTKIRQCNECEDGLLFTTRNIQTNENKEFEANLNLIKREAPNEFGYMLPYYKMYFSTFCIKSSIIYSCVLLFTLYTLANFFNSSKVYVFSLRSIKRQKDEHLTCLLLHVSKMF